MAAVDLTHVNAMSVLAKSQGFTVTSTTGGTHNVNSKHSKGLAIDIRTRDKTPLQVSKFITFMQGKGYRVLDERTRPSGQAVWGGPHLHIEVKTVVAETVKKKAS